LTGIASPLRDEIRMSNGVGNLVVSDRSVSECEKDNFRKRVTMHDIMKPTNCNNAYGAYRCQENGLVVVSEQKHVQLPGRF
jgi:hypothetical protein